MQDPFSAMIRETKLSVKVGNKTNEKNSECKNSGQEGLITTRNSGESAEQDVPVQKACVSTKGADLITEFIRQPRTPYQMKRNMVLNDDVYNIQIFVHFDKLRYIFNTYPGVKVKILKNKIKMMSGLDEDDYWLETFSGRVLFAGSLQLHTTIDVRVKIRGVGGSKKVTVKRSDSEINQKRLEAEGERRKKKQQQKQTRREKVNLNEAAKTVQSSYNETKNLPPPPTPQTQEPKLAVVEEKPIKNIFEKQFFDYYEAGYTFVLTGKKIKKQGCLPCFCMEFIDSHAGVSVSPVNFHNMLAQLWKTESLLHYLIDKDNSEIVDLKVNIAAYYVSLSHDVECKQIFEVVREITSAHKDNVDNMKNTEPLGFSLKNIFMYGKKAVSNGMNEIGTRVLPVATQMCRELKDKIVKTNLFKAIETKADEFSLKDYCISEREVKRSEVEVVRETRIVTKDELKDALGLDDEMQDFLKEIENPKDKGEMCIFDSIPRASIVIEEVVKCFPGGWFLVGYVDDFVHASVHRLKWHKKSMRYGFIERYKQHVSHNFSCSHPDWLDQINEGLSEPMTEYDFSYVSPGHVVNTLPLSHCPKDYPLEKAGDMALQRKTCIKYFPILYPVTELVSYDSTAENYQAAVVMRVLFDKASRANNFLWQSLKLPTHVFEYVPNYDNWFNSLKPIQKKKVARHKEALENGERIDTRTKVFVKTRELIKPKYPRLIFNVSPKYLLLLGDFLSQLSDSLYTLFPSEPTYTIDSNLTFYYISKFSTTKLNDYFNKSMGMNCGKHSLVLGDDTAILDRDENTFVEIDFSGYDSTQREGGALDIFPRFLKENGFFEQSNYYTEMYNEPIDWNRRDKKFEVKQKFKCRMSGEPGTSVANSLTTILAVREVWNKKCTYEDLGLVAKMKVSKDYFQMTFLKGIWLMDRNGYYRWTRLPSFICKFKSFTDPKTIYSKSWSNDQCYQQLFYSQWLGYGKIETNWFYKRLGNHVRRLCPTAKKIPVVYEYKIFNDDDDLYEIDDDVFDNFILKRYGLTRLEMEAFCSEIEEIKFLPAVYLSKVAWKLVNIDC